MGEFPKFDHAIAVSVMAFTLIGMVFRAFEAAIERHSIPQEESANGQGAKRIGLREVNPLG